VRGVPVKRPGEAARLGAGLRATMRELNPLWTDAPASIAQLSGFAVPTTWSVAPPGRGCCST
jgi:hypothetical protein